MRNTHKTTGDHARNTRDRTGRFDQKFTARAYDAIAFAAALEVLG